MIRAALPLRLCVGIVAVLATMPAMPIDLAALWDFDQPALSEQRFRDALQTAGGDDVLVLQTQIARTYGLRKDFERARALLREVEPRLAGGGAEARARWELEMGRSFASAAHAPAAQTDADRARARAHFERAVETAKAGGLDGLAIDAIHMLAFVDTAPADQLKWAQAALAVVDASSQPAAKRWEASIRNNLGYALQQLGRLDEALAQYRQALAIRERGANAQATHVARWMVARVLRLLGRGDEALAMQLQLERDADAAGRPDRHVFDELAALYRARGDDERARGYAERRRALPD